MTRTPFLDRDLKLPQSDSETRGRVAWPGRVAWGLMGVLVLIALMFLSLSALERNDYPRPLGYPTGVPEESHPGDQELAPPGQERPLPPPTGRVFLTAL